ncbi:MAG: 1-(5-phosphoribosyl)-5-[(5-phosphoribosylamino)methylideneamino]imidazole-4-carboxamide isomerase [Candidatus Omnitrophota bacterium]
MIVIPAIDLKDGKVVRLVQGSYDNATVYSENPVEAAQGWCAQGARRLHIVDLDGAKKGMPCNLDVARLIVQGIEVPVQLGGGLRRYQDIASILESGVRWVILGTSACEGEQFIKRLTTAFGEGIIISIDVRDGKVAVRGWTEASDISDVDLIKKMQGAGVRTFVYTDISCDGMLSGMNIDKVQKVLQNTGATLIYSGGVSSVEDIRHLKTLEKEGLSGVIIGKALYENKFTLAQAQGAAEE